MWTSKGRLQDPVAGHPEDQIMGRSGDVRKTLIMHFFFLKFNSQTYYTHSDRLLKTFLVNCSSKKFGKQ